MRRLIYGQNSPFDLLYCCIKIDYRDCFTTINACSGIVHRWVVSDFFIDGFYSQLPSPGFLIFYIAFHNDTKYFFQVVSISILDALSNIHVELFRRMKMPINYPIA